MVVVGAGGHAKVAIEALRYRGWEIVGCTDEDPTPRRIVGAPVLGTDEILREVHTSGVQYGFVALGANGPRQRLGERLKNFGFKLPAAVGPNVIVSSSASIGNGAALFGGAIVNAESCIGDYAIINTNASVDHDCRIGSAAHVAPGCVLAGCVKVGDRVFVGAGTTIIPGVNIGRDTVIGAGSVVIRDVPEEVTAIGAPATVRSRSDG